MRLLNVERTHNIKLRWRPFDVRHVMIKQNNIPFKDNPVQAEYMWRDIERRGQRYGPSPKVPAPCPFPVLDLANQVATLGVKEGWVEAYTRAAYKRWFENGEPAGEEPNLSSSLREIGCDPSQVLSAAQTESIVKALKSTTDEAMALGVFGSPTFTVDSEVFWGDDRLEDAVLWALS